MPGRRSLKRTDGGGRSKRKLIIWEHEMRQVVAMLRRVPPFVFFILSTLLFLLGAMSFNHAGGKTMAEIGVMGAVGAVAAIVAFRA